MKIAIGCDPNATEFKKELIEMFRVVLEEHKITQIRNGRTVTFPADFIFIAAANPCPFPLLHYEKTPAIIKSKNKNAAACGRANARKPMQVRTHLHNGREAAPHGI